MFFVLILSATASLVNISNPVTKLLFRGSSSAAMDQHYYALNISLYICKHCLYK